MVSLSTAPVARRMPIGLRAPSAIETRRLLLRRPIARYAGDPAVTKYLGWRTHRSLADSQMFLACCEAEWKQAGVGPYLLQSRENGEVLGSTALRLSSTQQAGTGYVLARDAWGQGYATE